MPKLGDGGWKRLDPGPDPVLGTDCGPYELREIGEAFGFTTIGAGIERLPPGSASSVRHWHASEDEFVLMISGRVTLVEDVETELGPGDVAGWRAGVPVAHRLENRGTEPAVYLVAGTRAARDRVTYPDRGWVLVDPRSDRRWERIPTEGEAG